MKKIILMTLLLFGCTHPFMQYSESIQQETQESISQKIKINETTNIDILNMFKSPYIKHKYSDGRYKYTYFIYYSSKYNYKPFSSSTGLIEEESKKVSFIFNSDNKLVKYEYSDDAIGEFNKFDVININEIKNNGDILKNIYDGIDINDSKSYVFNKMGKPLSIVKTGNHEEWKYIALYPKVQSSILNEMLFMLPENIPGTFFVIEFDKNKITKKYSYVVYGLTDEEKNIK